ncbi:uncharacterized protein LOC142550583 [Primulina tabacum]|uniref:uncharacterized protein LOC142550583 n=1 Tax=Primulina tabacum TaxID=48773 RepID=UPI003F59599E
MPKSLDVELEQFDPEIEKTFRRQQQRLKELMERHEHEHEEERHKGRHVEMPRRIPMLEYAQPSLDGSISTWEDMAKAFLIKYFPPSKAMKLQEDITTFAQFEQESLYEAWECFKDLLRRCPHHEMPIGLVVQTFYYGLCTPNRTMIDVAACGNLLRKTVEEGYESLEEMAASSYHPQSERDNQRRNAGVHQVTDLSAITAQLDVLNRKLDGLNMGGTAMRHQEIFYDKCGGEHFAKDYRNGNPFYAQKGAPVNQVGVQNRRRNDPYSNTYNPGWRQHPNFSWGGQNTLKKAKLDAQFGKFLKVFKKLHINIPFADALMQTPSYAKFLKDILANKRKLEDHMTIPPKLKYPGSFSIPCVIGDILFHKVLCDLGMSINLMPLSVLRKLGLREPKPTRMSLPLADKSVKYP